MIGAFLTGLYAFRMLFLVFWGEPSPFVREHLVAGLPRASTTSEGAVLDDALTRRRPHRARRDRRLDPVRRRLDADHRTGSSRSRGRSSRRAGRRSSSRRMFAVAARPGRDRRRLGALRRAQRRACRASRGCSALLEHKFYFDELYDAALLPAGRCCSRTGSRRWIERPLVLGSVRELAQGMRQAGQGHRPPADRPRPHVRARDRRERRRPHPRLRGGPLMDPGWLTTALILLPAAGALADLGAAAAAVRGGSTALLVRARRGRALDRRGSRASTSTQRGLQLDQQQSWFSDLNVSYHVGFYGFSIWLVGLTVVVLAAAIGVRVLGRPRAAARLLRADAAPDGRDRRRLRRPGPAALLRLLRGDADPALRAGRRLGRPGRLGATLKFVIYTMAGSLLMLASIIVLGLSQGTFDLVQLGRRAPATGSSSASSPPSRSRRRSSRCTAGCPTPTASRRRRSRRC